MEQHLICRARLGVPQSTCDVFTLLASSGWIEAALADSLKRMVDSRHIALHDDQDLQLPFTVAIIERNLDDLLDHSRWYG